MNEEGIIKAQSPIDFLLQRKKFIAESYDKIAQIRDNWIKKNRYYYNYLKKILNFIVEPNSKVLQIKCETGFFLNAVAPSEGLGVDSSGQMVELASKKYPSLKFKNGDIENIAINDKYDYVLLIHALNEIVDVQAMLENFKCVAKRQTRFVIVGYNKLWEPAIKLAEKFGIKINQPAPNWLSANDVKNFLHLSGYETIKEYKNILLPKKIPLISTLINGLIAKFPLVNNLCLIYTIVARCIIPLEKPGPSVSIIIPCKNEKGNIQTSVERIPNMGSHTEIIFGDDKSTDGTSDEIRRVMKLYPEKEIKLYEGPGVCKADNVWAGLKKATGDILMILDADLTVLPEELPKFYRAIIEGKGEFINGSRLVYPIAERSMKMSNLFGNKIFSILFSYILNQRVKDTLCGTKVFWREDYKRISRYIGTWGIKDRWGDYDLLFGATKINLKIIDLPIHYFERTYGETKMTNTISNGFRMLWISMAAFVKLRVF